MDSTAGRPAFAGIDTHKGTNTLALVDRLGRPVGTWEFPTGAAGYARLEEAIGDASVTVGVEGVRSYGAGVAAYLASRGYEVLEVVRPRREQRRRGKSDAIDALAAAANVAAGRGLAVKEAAGDVGDIGRLMTVREHFVRRMTEASNCIDSMVVTAPEAVRSRWGGSSGEGRIREIAATRPKDALQRCLRALARDWVRAKSDADALGAEIAALVARCCPALLGAPGIGPISAARLLVAAGSNPERMGGEAAFSMLCGTSPIPASTGSTSGRHRLNRGGNRQANRAIHEIARARMAHDPRTRDYIARKMAEGKTKREAVRCLCRFIAREVYRLITGPQEPLPDMGALAGRRRELGIPQAEVAAAIGATVAKVGRMERGAVFDGALMRAYSSYLDAVEEATEKGY